eukprot:scpid98511/ scgid0078/ 
MVPLKNKTDIAVRDAFRNNVRSSERSPRKLWVEEGKEFHNATLKRWLRCTALTTRERPWSWSASTGRSNRACGNTLSLRPTRPTSTWMCCPDSLTISDYNARRHRSIGMTPAEASRERNAAFVQDFPALRPDAHPPRFTEGDQVRIAVIQRHFKKGYTPNWTEEVFVVDGVLPTRPVTYRIRDLMDERVLGSFYEQKTELENL